MNKIIITIIITLFLFSSGYSLPDDENINIKGREFYNMSQNAFVSNISNILGNDIRGMWMMRKTDDGTQIKQEYSTDCNATFSGGLSFADRLSQGWGYRLFNLDADRFSYCADSDNFSFGNSTTDHTFSIVCVFRLNSAHNHTKSKNIIAKYDITASQYEYYARIDSATANIRFALCNNGALSPSYVTSSTIIQDDKWYCFVVTYSGVGGSSCLDGVNMYLNGEKETLTKSQIAYTAMKNTTGRLSFGARYYIPAPEGFIGDISCITISGTELTEDKALAIYKLVKGFYGL